jgi:hypothetical protein
MMLNATLPPICSRLNATLLPNHLRRVDTQDVVQAAVRTHSSVVHSCRAKMRALLLRQLIATRRRNRLDERRGFALPATSTQHAYLGITAGP